jgi:glycosyltransferase involved in cell wall biosynthesis
MTGQQSQPVERDEVDFHPAEGESYHSGSHATATKRVLCVVRYPVGGIRTHLRYNCPSLAEQGYRFTFLVPAETTHEPLAKTLAGLPDAEFVTVPGRGPACKLAPAIRQLLRSRRFDVIHSHGFTSAAQVVLATWGWGVPHVATIHDVIRPVQFPGWKGWFQRQALGWLLRQVTTIIPVGTDVRDNLLEYLPPLRGRKDRFVVIRHGIDAAHFARTHQPDRELRLELGLDPGTPLWGFLGRFMEQKGFLPLVEALDLLRSRHPEARFHVAAFGAGDNLVQYRRRVEELGLAKNITFLPFVPDAAPVLQQLDLLLMPSQWEALGLLALEAMVAGVPVLGTDCIGLREALYNTPARMTRTGDVEDLYRGLVAAWREPWNEAARAYAPLAARRYDNAHSAHSLLDVLDTLTGRTTEEER